MRRIVAGGCSSRWLGYTMSPEVSASYGLECAVSVSGAVEMQVTPEKESGIFRILNCRLTRSQVEVGAVLRRGQSTRRCSG